MLLNSLQFLLFFPAVVLLWYSTPFKFRWFVLLCASAFFYLQWQPAFTVLLGVLILVAYFVALQIANTKSDVKRRVYLSVGLCAIISPLLLFKYYGFVNDTLRALLEKAGLSYPLPSMRLLLPIGISFFTFKLISYLIDVYRKTIGPEHHAGKFALYVSFFPQILAGPIERARNFLPQLNVHVLLTEERITGGLKLMLWGLFKKAVIADRLALLVNRVYDTPADYSGMPLIIATYLFSFQIFCDFSGYSDMAIGAARILGFSTMENFERPYFSKSIAEFWRRWHISLSSWFKDYLYIPLGGSRTSLFVWCRNVMIVFLISGLWHGSYWTFIIWGGLHGAYLVAGRLRMMLQNRNHGTGPAIPRYSFARKAAAVFITFHLVTFAWIFFRASTVTDGFHVVKNLFAGLSFNSSVYGGLELAGAAMLIVLMEMVHLLQRRGSVVQQLKAQPLALRWAVYAALILCIINLRPQYQAPFLYMQF